MPSIYNLRSRSNGSVLSAADVAAAQTLLGLRNAAPVTANRVSQRSTRTRAEADAESAILHQFALESLGRCNAMVAARSSVGGRVKSNPRFARVDYTESDDE